MLISTEVLYHLSTNHRATFADIFSRYISHNYIYNNKGTLSGVLWKNVWQATVMQNIRSRKGEQHLTYLSLKIMRNSEYPMIPVFISYQQFTYSTGTVCVPWFCPDISVVNWCWGNWRCLYRILPHNLQGSVNRQDFYGHPTPLYVDSSSFRYCPLKQLKFKLLLRGEPMDFLA